MTRLRRAFEAAEARVKSVQDPAHQIIQIRKVRDLINEMHDHFIELELETWDEATERGLTGADIGRLTDRSKQNVNKRLTRYREEKRGR